MIRLLFIIISICYTTVGFSQLDSLRKLLQSDYIFAHDSNEVITRYEYAVELYYASEDSLDQAIVQADESFELARKNNLVRHQINAYNLRGIILRKLGKFEEALQTYDQIITLAQDYNLDLRAGQMMDNKANVYLRMRKEDNSLALKLDALDIFKELGDSATIAKSYLGIGSLYLSKGDFQKSIQYNHRAIKHSTHKDKAGNRAFAMGNMAIAHKRINQLDSALFYFLECKELSNSFKYLQRDNDAQLALFYINQEQYDKATPILKSLIDRYNPESKSFSLHYYRLLLAQCLQEKNTFNEAAEALSAVDTAAFKNRTKQLEIYFKVSSRLNFENKNYKTARDEFRLFRDLKDSLTAIEKDINFKEIEEKYEVAEKEKIIATQELSLKKRTIYSILLAAILGITTLLFLLRQRKIKYAKALTEQKNIAQATEIENLQKENKIISMQSMLEGQEEERLRIARDLHDNIGSLMTTIKFKVLEIQRNIQSIQEINITGELDSMINTASQEIRRISHRMTPVALDIAGLEGAVFDLGQQLRDNQIEPTMNIETLDQVDDKNLAINIFRIIQEIVTNCIKHSKADKMIINTRLDDLNLHIHISDNGVGFDSSIKDQSNSIGLSGIKSRINYLNGELTIDSNGQTVYDIKIPLNYSTDQ